MKIIDAHTMAELADYSGIVEWLHQCHQESVDAMDDLLLTQPAATSGSQHTDCALKRRTRTFDYIHALQHVDSWSHVSAYTRACDKK